MLLRRPLMGAGMFGGLYLARRASQNAAYRGSQSQPQHVEAPAAAPAAGEDDTLAKLKQLGDLRSSGVLSEDEFQAAKAKVLAS
jgi:hypothetical protein